MDKVLKILRNRLEGETLDAFEICIIAEDRLSIEARDGGVESLVANKQRGVAVRAVHDQKMGCSSSTDFSEHALERLVTSVLVSLNEVSPSEEAIIPLLCKEGKGEVDLSTLPNPPPPQSVGGHGLQREGDARNFQSIPISEKIAIALALEREAKAVNPKITRVRQPLYEEVIRHVSIVNSYGVNKTAERGMASCEVRAVAEDNGISEAGWSLSSSPCFDKLDVMGTSQDAARRALSLMGASSVSSGRYDIVFDSRAVAQLLRLFVPSFFAGNVQRGKSTIADKKGTAEYISLLTVVDDGLLPDGFGSFPFDDEGVARRKNFLVKDGVIIDWLYDTARANRDKKQSTGNGIRASIHQPPTVDVSNCYICAGGTPTSKLYLMAEKGILIRDVIGLHMANTITGDFSLGAEGFLLDGGKMGKPLRGIIVAGNVHNLFKNAGAVGDDLKFYYNYGAPSIFVPSIQISGTES